jgi:hypothetical protein
VADNLLRLARQAEPGRDDLTNIIRNVFSASRLDDGERQAYLDRVEDWVASA